MRILIGSIFRGRKKNPLAICFPGVGTFEASPDKEDAPFDSIVLDKDSMISIRDELNRLIECQ